MRIEKWKINDEEVDVPIVDDEDIETNEDQDWENTQPIKVEEINDQDE